ncbi:MAG: dihydroorotase [Candidatus Marinimicrobia bacterium]|nr:dihydroorotase [Candidatus Neomarinimicrobiota bacterium]MBL7009932.1 dihydroorotase [Candidatus Neomarinimicrobiota bacterium]MBL7029769.1 dihydroorotase [Candidatus Neomarinimicrobiota bacterium]
MKTVKLKKQVLLKGGSILDPIKATLKKGDVLIENGKIQSVGKVTAPKAADVVDCSGLIVTHGFCDVHVHFREPGREDKETLDSGSMAALAGGFTRVCVMPNTEPPLDSPESIRYTIDRAEECPIHIHPIGAITKGQDGKELTEMGAMLSEGAVAFSDDGLPVTDTGMMRNALEYATMFDVPVINHAEDLCLKKDGVMHEGTVSTHLGLPASPDITESNMVHRDLELTELTGARLHVPHVSSAKSTDHIRQMKKSNNKITAEVTPHHLFFTDEDLTTYNTHLKVAPPIRTKADRKALIKAAKDGTFDCIATDHAPHTIEEKEGTFDLAPFGMIGLESCFGAVNRVLVKENKMDIIRLIQMLTINPRKIMGIETDLYGEGNPAELTIFDPDEKWTFSKTDIYSRSHNSPYIGKSLVGRPKFTIVKGYRTESVRQSKTNSK